jgi:predicted GNAT family acetyltransferase
LDDTGLIGHDGATLRGRGSLALAYDRDVTAAETDDLTVVDKPAEQRYEAHLGERTVGFSEYRRDRDRVIFLHTEVDPAFEGRGIGGRLAAGALDDVRARGLRMTVKCPFSAAYLLRHPEYEDLRAP